MAVAIAAPIIPYLGIKIKFKIILTISTHKELIKINLLFLCKDKTTINNGTNAEIKNPMARIDKGITAGKYFVPKIILTTVPGKDNNTNKTKIFIAKTHFETCFAISSTSLISPLAKCGPTMGRAKGSTIFGNKIRSWDTKKAALYSPTL